MEGDAAHALGPMVWVYGMLVLGHLVVMALDWCEERRGEGAE